MAVKLAVVTGEKDGQPKGTESRSWTLGRSGLWGEASKGYMMR